MTLGVISEAFGLMVPHGRLGECIAAMEDALHAMRETPFHAVLGRNFLHLVDPAAEYIAGFHERASARIAVGALYFEMNGFDINPDRWFFNGFAYRKAGDVWDLDWLADWHYDEPEDLTLTGMEKVQEAFAGVHPVLGNRNQPLAVRIAKELAEHLVLARYMELIAGAHQRAKDVRPALGGLPVLATAHEWDVVHVTE